MALIISQKVRAKLSGKNPPVTEDEIEQAFVNRDGPMPLDTRARHASDPPTRWFISETDYGRKLKVAFILLESGDIVIRTAYDPNSDELSIYNEVC